MKIGVVIPALNEEPTIRQVLEAVCEAGYEFQSVVVADGSTDKTADIAREFQGVQVLQHDENFGKGAAMASGVEILDPEIILFLDGDLIGLRAEHIKDLIEPVASGSCEMNVGVFGDGRFWSDTAQRVSPELSGQRALIREIWNSINDPRSCRLGIEVAINLAAKKRGDRVNRCVLQGVSHRHKEQKLGLVRGAQARAKMYAEIGRTYFIVKRENERDE